MKKILGLTIAALLVMAMVGGGTWAYFSDTETSGANVLSAGTLDLTLGGATAPFSIAGMKPGDSGDPEVSWTLTQSGSLSGNLTIAMGTVTNNENTIWDPESDQSDSTDDPKQAGTCVTATTDKQGRATLDLRAQPDVIEVNHPQYRVAAKLDLVEDIHHQYRVTAWYEPKHDETLLAATRSDVYFAHTITMTRDELAAGVVTTSEID